MSFFKNVIAHLMKTAEEATTSYSVVDPTAAGKDAQTIRTITLTTTPIDEQESILSLSWDGSSEKVFEKKLSNEEVKHVFDLMASDLSEAHKLVEQGNNEGAKTLLENLLKKYTVESGDIVETNLPKLVTTQAEKDIDEGLWKTAGEVKMQNIFPSGTIQNLTFFSTEDLSAYTEKQKGIQPGKEVPLWEQEGKKAPESKDSLVPSSLSYEDVEKQKEEEYESLKDHMDSTIKQELESALQEKAASIFSPADEELVKAMRAPGVGRNWDEIKKYFIKSLNRDEDATVIFIDEQRKKMGDDGVEILPKEEPKPGDVLRPPKELVPDSVHEKLLQDLEDKKKDKEPIEEVKEIEKVEEPPIVEESAQKSICPECDGEGDVPAVRGGHVTAIPCPSCSGDRHIEYAPKELESDLNLIERADNQEIRKIAADTHEHTCSKCDKVWECHKGQACNEGKSALCGKHYSEEEFGKKESSLKVATNVPIAVVQKIKEEIVPSIYRMNAPGAKFYRFSVEGNKIYRGDYNWEEDFGPYQFIYNMDTGMFKENPTYKPTAFASLKRAASYMSISEDDFIIKTAADDTNPLQEAIEEIPTMQTPEQDRVPMGKPMDHNAPVKGDRVYVASEISGDEKAGFSGNFISEYSSKGEKFYIVETDKGDLLDVAAVRVSKVNAGDSGVQTADPIAEPQIEAPKEAEIPVTPSLDSLHSASSLKQADEASDELRFERAVNMLDKKLMRGDIHQEEYDAAYENLKRQMFPNEIDPNKHLESSQDDLLTIKAEAEQLLKIIKEAEEEKDVCSKCGKEVGLIEMSKWVADGLCSECRGIDKQSAEEYTYNCKGCMDEFKSKEKIEGLPYCPQCSAIINKKEEPKVASDFEKGISQNKTADEPVVEPKTQFKELKKAPAYTDREKAIPASPELDQVLSKLDALEQNLATLDTAKKQILAKAKEEVAKLEQSAERVQMEKELQESINKSGVLIDALENKVVAWRDKIYTMQTQEVSYVPSITPKEMLEKIYAKFEGAQRFVESVLSGMLSQAKTITEKTLVRFPGKKSSLNKEASIIDEWNDELLAALKELSSPL